MIVFLSASFLRRLELDWKPDLRAVLMGHRNLFFFTPDTLKEVPEITTQVLDDFLSGTATLEGWELLGTIAPGGLLPAPGLAQLITGQNSDPLQWKAWIYLLEDGDLKQRSLEIRLSGRSAS
jgi:hypothetical protein